MAVPAVAEPESRMTLTKVVYRLKKWKHLLGCRVFRAPAEVPLQRCSPYLAQVCFVCVLTFVIFLFIFFPVIIGWPINGIKKIYEAVCLSVSSLSASNALTG